MIKDSLKLIEERLRHLEFRYVWEPEGERQRASGAASYTPVHSRRNLEYSALGDALGLLQEDPDFPLDKLREILRDLTELDDA